MRDRARHLALRGGNQSFGGLGLSGGMSVMGQMGPIKTFGELQDSVLKLRENFDAIVLGKFNLQTDLEIPETTPLKKKDFLAQESESNLLGGASLREQEQETDEEDSSEMIQTGRA